MNKKQVIEALKALGVTDEEMKDLEYNDLRALLKLKEAEASELDGETGAQGETGATEQEGASDEKVGGDGAEESKDDNVQDTPSNDAEVEPLAVTDIKLGIYENKVLPLLPSTKRITVENVGGGDAYVDVTSITFDPKAKLSPGEKKEFKGLTRLFVKSASRPVIRLTQFDK